jgi:hypothetical protein
MGGAAENTGADLGISVSDRNACAHVLDAEGSRAPYTLLTCALTRR